MKSIKSDWESYESQIIPKHAGPVQRRETRQAFYAGAWSFFTLILKEGQEGLERAQEELVQFYKKAEMECELEKILQAFRDKVREQ